MAPLTVARHATADPEATRFELVKQIERGGRTFTASVWLNVHQMRAIARDHGT